MSSRVFGILAGIALITVGCGNPVGGRTTESSLAPSSLTGPSLVLESDTGEGAHVSGVLGGDTLKQTLSGPTIDGVVPEGEALADHSQFVNGGDTLLTVRVKNVNLADGTSLDVTLSFTPVGTLTLSRGEGSLTTSLGHFGVSRDAVRVNQGGITILSGGFFR